MRRAIGLWTGLVVVALYLPVLCGVLASLGQLDSFEETGRSFSEEAVTAFMVTNQDNPGSIISSVQAVRDNVRSLREQVSAELWEAVNAFYLELAARDLTRDLQRQRYELYGFIKERSQMIAGVADETMPRNEGWRFFTVGRQLERAIMGARLLDVYFQDLPDTGRVEFHHWRNLLRAASAFEAYNRRQDSAMRPQDAVDYLLLDTEHPRSILFCLREAERELTVLESADPQQTALRATGRARSLLEFSEPGERAGANRNAFLRSLILNVQAAINGITTEYFAPSRPGALRALEVG